jgi:hypothetical protein
VDAGFFGRIPCGDEDADAGKNAFCALLALPNAFVGTFARGEFPRKTVVFGERPETEVA